MEKRMATILRKKLLVALGILVMVSAFPASAMAAPHGTQPGPAAAVSISLYGSTTGGWGLTSTSITTPGPTLTVDQGDVITFTLFAQDSQAHTLVIDLDRDGTRDTGEPESSSFDSPTTGVTFQYTANTAGTSQYYCGLHGASVMKGTLTVRATGGPAPSGDNTLLFIGVGIAAVAIVAVVAMMMMRKKKPGP